MGEFITTTEAARRLHLHVSTIRAWVREGAIPALRVGPRFTRLDWEAVLAALQRRPETGGCREDSEHALDRVKPGKDRPGPRLRPQSIRSDEGVES